MWLKESCNLDFKNSWKPARRLVTTSTKDELYWGIINIESNTKKTREIEKYFLNNFFPYYFLRKQIL